MNQNEENLSPTPFVCAHLNTSLRFHSKSIPFDAFSLIAHINPLTPKSDQLLISPYIITPESNTKVTGIKEMITNL